MTARAVLQYTPNREASSQHKMGGGNAQKSEIARQRNAARAAANAGGKYVPFLPDRFMLQRK